jgi:predicted esterase
VTRAFGSWFQGFLRRPKSEREDIPLPPPPSRIDAYSRPDPAVVAVLDDPRATADQRLKAVRHLVRFGRIGHAVGVVSAMLEDPALRNHAKLILEQIRAVRQMGLERVRMAEGDAAQRLPEDRGYWVASAGSDTTVIAFTGMAMRLDISIYFMQRLLSRFGVNVIYVFDWHDTYYYGGVNGLGRNLQETARSLRRLCRELNSKRVICFGQSSGAYAAIRYGVKLKADGVLAFSPVILPVRKQRILGHIARKTGVKLTPRDTDLRVVLTRAKRLPFTRIVLGDANPGDVRSARHISDLKNVVELVLPGVKTHGTVEHTMLSGAFPDIFRAFCDDVGPGRWEESVKPRRAPSGRRSRGSRARARRRRPAAADLPR